MKDSIARTARGGQGLWVAGWGPIISLAMKRNHRCIIVCLALGALLVAVGACRPYNDYDDSYELPPPDYETNSPYLAPVPEPIDLLLPHKISIHPFTGTQTSDEAGGPIAIEARIKTLDAFGDPTKAFGQFRFSLHQYRQYSTNERGEQLAVWEEDLLDAKVNRRHWDPISQSYKFQLRWSKGLATGQHYVLEAQFVSPFTERLFDQRVFVAE